VRGEFILVPAKFYFFLIISFLVYNTSWATNYYVDKNHSNASDNNPGTQNLPFETIQKGIDIAQAGDTVFIKSGIYVPGSAGLRMVRSGTSGNKIVFKNYGNDSVVVDLTGAPKYSWDWTGFNGTFLHYLVIDGLYFENGTNQVVIRGN